jgi:hypothetical protein
MFIDTVIFEGPTCSGKSWMINKVNKETNYKWCLVDRGNISGVIENMRRGRPNWSNREGMLKRNLREGQGIVHVVVDTDLNTVRERYQKRGDDQVCTVEELESEWRDWRHYIDNKKWLNDNIKVKRVHDWKECISYLNWLEKNVIDQRGYQFGRENSEIQKKYNEHDSWSKLRKDPMFDFEILEEDYKNVSQLKVLFKERPI